MTYFTSFFLDNEKDIIVNLYWDLGKVFYELETPNHHSGNLIRNLAKICDLPLSKNDKDFLVIRGEIPCFINGDNQEVYIFRIGDTKIANIYPKGPNGGDGYVEVRASIPSISKTLMSQTRDYQMDQSKTIFKTFIQRELKFRSDLHTHMNGNLSGDTLIALGIYHQIRYPLYYVRKLGLELSPSQEEKVMAQREKVAKQFVDSGLKGKYLTRRINDNTYINFADLILNNLDHAEANIVKIRTSLAILKDGQAVFTNLEKVYLYRYVFCKGKESEEKIPLTGIYQIPDQDVRENLSQMLKDGENPDYAGNSIFQDKLLWIARTYQQQGVRYAEISDTTLVKKYESLQMLNEVHEVMPKIYKETGVMIRFLAAIRRIPLTIVKDAVTPDDYLSKNISVLQATALDPYVAGCDFVGEEINDIITLKPAFKEIVKIAANDPDFVIRVHAGENDSQKANISHSIACVRDSLANGQAMPKMRLGHGLYTYSLKSAKGKQVLQELKDNGVVLEFQITSNVRLNNLNALENHPLRQYLKEGIACVQGTDGAALYGTNSLDEQLSLEKLLDLSYDEMMQMKMTENKIIEEAEAAFKRKKREFRALLGNQPLEEVLLSRMNEFSIEGISINKSRHFDTNTVLKEQIEELPWDKKPIVIMGGSFNTEKRATRVRDNGTQIIDQMMEHYDPEEVFFVIGHKLKGYEEYLVSHNTKGFTIFCVVPALLTLDEKKRLEAADVKIRVSTEAVGMGIYKSFNYEIFERRPSILVAFDGNSAADNMIQEAKNGKGKAYIYVWESAKVLWEKAKSLQGYVNFFDDQHPLMDQIIADTEQENDPAASKYQIIALDMDGTILDSHQQVTDRVIASIKEAQAAGKFVAISTGRCLSELRPYQSLLDLCDYAVMESGALIYDSKKHKIMRQTAFDPESAKSVIDMVADEDIMLYGFLNGYGQVTASDVPQMAKYHIDHYQPLFEKYIDQVEDSEATFRGDLEHIEKFCLFHTSTEARDVTFEKMKNLHVELAYSEITSLEVSPVGIDKGSALQWLCGQLGLTTEQLIGVGDADNDLGMLKVSGLSIAMANANEHVRQASDVMVADNDHDGVAQAIQEHLLGKKTL